MKKLLIFTNVFLMFFVNSLQAQICNGVSVQAFAREPQTGSHNYFGVRVTLNQPYSQNVTVTGTIHSSVDPGSYPTAIFTLTVPAGSLTAQTSDNFYQMDPTGSAEVTVESINPCPVSNFTPEQQSENFINWIDYNVNYLINNNFQDYTNIEAIKSIMENNLNSFYSTYGIIPRSDSSPVTLTQNEWLANQYNICLENALSEDEFVNNLNHLKSEISYNANFSLDEKQVYSSFVDLVMMLVQYCNSKFPDVITYQSRYYQFDHYLLRQHNTISSFQFASFYPNSKNNYQQHMFRRWWEKWGRCVFGVIGSSWAGQIAGCTGAGALGASVGGVHGAIVGCAAGLVVGNISGALVGAATFCN